MVYTTSVIKDGVFVKSHIEYPVTNKHWKLMQIELSVYLDSLGLSNLTDSIFESYNDIWNWYLRTTKGNGTNFDPWNRLFVCYPPDKTHYQDDLYNYKILTNDNFCVCIVVTTVSGMKVYCVDVIKG